MFGRSSFTAVARSVGAVGALGAAGAAAPVLTAHASAAAPVGLGQSQPSWPVAPVSALPTDPGWTCELDDGCLLYSGPKDAHPVIGAVGTALEFEDPADRTTALAMIRGQIPASDVELQAIVRAAGSAQSPEQLQVVEERYTVYFSNVVQRHATVSRAGVGKEVGDQLWRWNTTWDYGYWVGTPGRPPSWVAVGSFKFTWRNYLGWDNPYEARVQFEFQDATRPIKMNPDATCREDKFVDENCDDQPNTLDGMSWYGSSYFDASNYNTNSGSKMFLNLEMDWYATGFSDHWVSEVYTSYRWKCTFSSPKCQYTGSS